MTAYRDEKENLQRRVAELEGEAASLQAKLDDVDVALLRAENERLQRQMEAGPKRDRTREVQAGKDRLARVFGALALGIGASFLVALIYVVAEPGPTRVRFLVCLVACAIAPSAWGILRLVRGAERED